MAATNEGSGGRGARDRGDRGVGADAVCADTPARILSYTLYPVYSYDRSRITHAIRRVTDEHGTLTRDTISAAAYHAATNADAAGNGNNGSDGDDCDQRPDRAAHAADHRGTADGRTNAAR